MNTITSLSKKSGAVQVVSTKTGRPLTFKGAEIDPTVLKQTLQSGLAPSDLANVRIGNFLKSAPAEPINAIVANPPYVRHHRIPQKDKVLLRAIGTLPTGQKIDGRAGLHIYFFIQSLRLLAPGGRLAIILPADSCEGVFAGGLWSWILADFRLDGVITFDATATPFPHIDTNAVIFLIVKKEPKPVFSWVRVHQNETPFLAKWVARPSDVPPSDDFTVYTRSLSEGLATGLSRFPAKANHNAPTLGDYARVMRGIASGNQDFFFLTSEQVKSRAIPSKFFIRAIGRTRDVASDVITPETLVALEKRNRPTWLLSLDSRGLASFPRQLQQYLLRGERMGLPGKALLSQRRPWYKMEVRKVPPFLFAYLGRRNTRFIRNDAGVVPLTGFLCVYPFDCTPEGIHKMWRVLNHPDTLAGLALVGKSYGQGALKVEPRALERLPLPENVLREVGLNLLLAKQPGMEQNGHPTRTGGFQGNRFTEDPSPVRNVRARAQLPLPIG
ncbi:MAG: SAM-dependent methyltransferase [Chloroflexi bacterium]|nr:SAM-dependent methyltransferase [Chloroflexota bacterium]